MRSNLKKKKTTYLQLDQNIRDQNCTLTLYFYQLMIKLGEKIMCLGVVCQNWSLEDK